MKNCPKGEYYCFTDEKCKPIPKGHHVMDDGKLMKDDEHEEVSEENKSGDSSLHDWFGKSKSSDGKSGWVQLGGKYAGKPCAKQPGQTTKPKCGSSKMKRALSKDEEERAFRRKNLKDPNPERKGKAINVATEETKKDHEYSMARSELKTVKNAAKRLEKKMGKKGEGNLEAWVQSKITKAADYIDTAADYVTNEEFVTLPLQIEIPTNIRDFNLGLMFRESLDQNSGMLFIFDEVAEQSFYMKETRIPLDIAFITEEGIIESIKELDPFDETPVTSDGEVICALEVNRGWFAENNIEEGDEIDIVEAAGEKDACYSKVKSRYKVWPSAYASGALVKCRKVGASNWGNKTKKEEFDVLGEAGDWWHPDPKKDSQISGAGNKARAREDRGQSTSAQSKPDYSKRLKPGESYMDFAKRKQAEKSGNKPAVKSERKRDKVGRSLGNLVDRIGGIKKEEVECNSTKKGKECPVHGIGECPLDEAVRIPSKTGNIILVTLSWRGKYYGIKMFFPQVTKPSRKEVQNQIDKVYPGAKVQTYYVSEVKPGEQFLQTEDWQKVNRKDKTDGLSQKAVDAYRRENPGSKLQTAVTEKKPTGKRAERRKSFCRRMKGMKSKLTSAETSRDPDSRINKALRRWNCN